MSLKLETRSLEVDGRTYQLRCNMSVLAELEAAHDGDFGAVAALPPIQGMAEILSAMLNDYADDMGWPTDWTPKKVKKRFGFAELLDADILGLFRRSLEIPGAEVGEPANAEAAAEPGDSGN